MKKILFFVLVFISFVNSGLAQLKDGAWIEEKFASDIMERKNINGTHLFPIVGFEFGEGNMYVLTYGGELQPVTIVYKKNNIGQIVDFESTINTQEWPEIMVNKYRQADCTIKIEKDVIVLTILCAGKKETYRFISNLDGSRFKTILEMKGWLLNYLIPPVFPEGRTTLMKLLQTED